MVLFFIAFYTTPFSSKHFLLGRFVRSLSTQLFVLVVLLRLLLSMTAFSYVRLLSLFWVWLFHAVFLSHLPPTYSLEGLSSELFAEFGSVHLLDFSTRACSLAFLSPFVTIFRAVFIYLVLLGGLFLGLSLFSDSVDFSYFFLFFSGGFHASSTVVFLFLVLFFLAGLHCLLRMHALNSCVGDTWQRLWGDDFTHNGKQVVNRLKIPQGLSTLNVSSVEWSFLKGRSPQWFTGRKTEQLYKEMTFWLSPEGLLFIGNLFRSSSTQFLVVQFLWTVHGTVFCQNTSFLWLLLRSLSTQLFVIVVLLCLVHRMTAFCYEHIFWGLCWGRFFHQAVCP